MFFLKRLIKRVADRYKTYMDWLNSADEYELGGYYSDRYKDEFGIRPCGEDAKFDSVDDLKKAILNLDKTFIEEFKTDKETIEDEKNRYASKTAAKHLKKVAKNLEELTDEEYEDLKKILLYLWKSLNLQCRKMQKKTLVIFRQSLKKN